MHHQEGEWTGGAYTYGTLRGTASQTAANSNHAWGISCPTSTQARYSAAVKVENIAGESRSPLWAFATYADTAGATIRGGGYNGTSSATLNNLHPDSLMTYSSLSAFGQLSTPVPNTIIFYGLDGIFRRLGTLPDIALCRMDGITPRTIIEIAGAEWMIFPPTTYRDGLDSAPTGEDSSAEAGVLYRIIR